LIGDCELNRDDSCGCVVAAAAAVADRLENEEEDAVERIAVAVETGVNWDKRAVPVDKRLAVTFPDGVLDNSNHLK
jgi:hypothetical protein